MTKRSRTKGYRTLNHWVTTVRARWRGCPVGVEDDVESEADRHRLAAAMWDQLTPDERLVLVGKRLGFSNRELARALRRSAASLREIATRARTKMRR